MSVLHRAAAFAVRYLPDATPDPMLNARGHIGRPLSRVDGPVKVTGEAQFSAEFRLEGLVHATLVCSSIAKGRVTGIDRDAAEAAPGVLAVLTHANAPKMKAPKLLLADGQAAASSDLPIFQDDRVHWNGQPVAVVIAETRDQADYAASLVRVQYATEPARLSMKALESQAVVPDTILGQPPELRVGDAIAALASAPKKVDGVYSTPWYNHNALELHATLAAWSPDGRLTVYDTTQCIRRLKESLADIFEISADDVHVIAPFVGGAFGGKGLWQNTVLCAAAAQLVKRPVRLMLPRQHVYRVVGGRTLTEQRVALGAHADGHLAALIHTGLTVTPEHARYAESCTFAARHLYAADNLFVGQKIVQLDTLANTWLRAPGEAVGTFALESALDELAYELGIDPIELRRVNEPAVDPTEKTPFSIRHLTDAYARGAERFEWRRGIPPRSQQDGRWLVGQGVATAYYPHLRLPGSARIVLHAEGTAEVHAAAHEIGVGTATAQIQHAAERLGLPLDKVSFLYGDSTLPDSPFAAGSCQTASVIGSVQVAAGALHERLAALARVGDRAVLKDATVENTQLRDGGLFSTSDPAKGESLVALLARSGQDQVTAEGTSGPPLELMKYSMASYGAQFCEVRVREDSGEVRVSRWVGSFDCGRIVNPKTVASQLRGSIIMGIGMALSEQTLVDERTGRIMNPSLTEYHVPVNLDVPEIDILVTDIPDPHAPLGVHGVGEIGITGVAAALANAVFHATGKRIRDLPITVDKVMS